MDRLRKADAFLAAADAGMARAHRPGLHPCVPEQDDGTVGVGLRTLAAELVQAVALAVVLVAEFQRETAGIEMSAALAIFVDEPAVGEERAAQFIDGRQFAEGEEVNHGGKEIVRVRRTAGNGHDVVAAERFGDANRARRVWRRGGHAAPGSAGAYRNDRSRTRSRLASKLKRGLAADLAINTAVLHGNGAFDHEQILALVLLHRGLLGGLDLVAGGGEQRLVVVERDDIEDQLFERGMLGAKHRFRAARAFLVVQPDNGRPLFLGNGLGNLCRRTVRQAHGRGDTGAKCHELAPAYPEAVLDFVQFLLGCWHFPPPLTQLFLQAACLPPHKALRPRIFLLEVQSLSAQGG